MIFQEGIRVHSLALEMLARDGFAAIWVLHLLAARAYREGRKAAATAIITGISVASTRRAAETFFLTTSSAALGSLVATIQNVIAGPRQR